MFNRGEPAMDEHVPSQSASGTDAVSHVELLEAWRLLSDEDRLEGLRLLPRADMEELFLTLDSHDQADLLLLLPASERRSWIRLLPPDDAADLIQQAPEDQRDGLLALLDDATRVDVTALLKYAEDQAGGLMNPRYARLRPDMIVDEAIKYLRRLAREHVEVIYYAYVLDSAQRLIGVVSFRDLMTAPPYKTIGDIMHTELVTVPESMDQEAVSHLFAQQDFIALPVVDADGRMKGIVTADDIVDVVKEEATEDIQKLGGMQALDAPYAQAGFGEMFRKRVVWLIVLFLGQTLTLTAMSYFEVALARAEVLALFIPLILSSGGNSGSQASTLVIRALALGELQLRDWWRVMRLELAIGAALAGVLGGLALVRVVGGHFLLEAVGQHGFGIHFVLLSTAIALSVFGVVVWGTLMGAMLPLLLRRAGVDPASASTPFIATLVDVTGILIYFGVATTVLRGTLL